MERITIVGGLVVLLLVALVTPVGAEDVSPVPLCTNQEATIVGTGGSDVLRGTEGNDVIVGLGGADRIFGLGGDDLICGGRGADKIRGGTGNDRLFGDAGDDIITGQVGDDTILGGSGDDQLYGRTGADGIGGGRGDDVIRGGTGPDRVFGGRGNDFVDGGAGRDLVVGADGDDSLFGRTGEDHLVGGPDSDWCQGGDGFDWAEKTCETIESATATRGRYVSRLLGRTLRQGERLSSFGLRGGPNVVTFGSSPIQIGDEFPLAMSYALYDDGSSLWVLRSRLGKGESMVVDVLVTRLLAQDEQVVLCYLPGDSRQGAALGIATATESAGVGARPSVVWKADVAQYRWVPVDSGPYSCDPLV